MAEKRDQPTFLPLDDERTANLIASMFDDWIQDNVGWERIPPDFGWTLSIDEVSGSEGAADDRVAERARIARIREQPWNPELTELVDPHVLVLDSMTVGDVADALVGDFRVGAIMLVEELEARTREYGPDHQSVQDLSDFADVVAAICDGLEAAIETTERDISELEASTGRITVELARLRFKLIEFRTQQLETSFIREILEPMLAGCVQALGLDHRSVDNMRREYVHYALIYGEGPAAAESLEVMLAPEIERLGEDHHLISEWREDIEWCRSNPEDYSDSCRHRP